MGKATDIVGALVLLVIAIIVLTRMGIDLSMLISYFYRFLYGPSATNATSGMIRFILEIAS